MLCLLVTLDVGYLWFEYTRNKTPPSCMNQFYAYLRVCRYGQADKYPTAMEKGRDTSLSLLQRKSDISCICTWFFWDTNNWIIGGTVNVYLKISML